MYVVRLDVCLSPTIVLLHRLYFIACSRSPQSLYSFTKLVTKIKFFFTVQVVYIAFNSLSQILVFNHKTSAGGLPHRTVFSNTEV